MYLSELQGSRLLDPSGRSTGRLFDLVADLQEDAAPLVTGLVARHRRKTWFLPIDEVGQLDSHAIRLAMPPNYAPFVRRPQHILLARDLMDSQVIDLHGPRVVRVNDVLLEQSNHRWQVSGVDIGARALLRRLLPHAMRHPHRDAVALRWVDFELLATDIPGDGVQPDHRRLARLHPADIARVADAVPARQATEIVASLEDDLAADTMEEMIDELQADVIETLDPERAADILEHMAPDAAADVLAELEPDSVDDVLRRMVPEAAADLHALLTYPKDTAGGLMTTDYLMAPRGMRVRKAIDYLRTRMEKPDWVYYIYVVEDVRERRLVGVLSLRDLLLARQDQPVDELMTFLPRHVHPDEPAARVAQIMSDYNLPALPVTDPAGRLLGIISIDDALEVVLPATLRRRVPRVFS